VTAAQNTQRDPVSDSPLTDLQLRQAQKLEAIGQLTGGIAHDFNNILTGVIGYTTVALNQAEGQEELRETLKVIYRKANEAASLIQQLLAFSRKQILDRQPLHINTVLRDTVHFLRRVIRDNIDLESDLEDVPGLVHADKTAIQQIITNLCVNAQDALPEGGLILIRSEAIILSNPDAARRLEIDQGNYFRFSVQDDGIGMDEETQTRIFEPFFTTKAEEKGTGLGLATVYGLVKQHDGAIQVTSKPGKGTCFDVYLPLVVDEIQTPAPDLDLEVARGEETILIVENDPDVLAVAQHYLKMAGYRTLTAPDGVAGLKLFGRREQEIDLVLTDIVMPGLNGIELSEYIRKIRRTTPVLFMTGYADEEQLKQMGPGAEIMQKPVTAGALTKRVRKLLDREEGKKGG